MKLSTRLSNIGKHSTLINHSINHNTIKNQVEIEQLVLKMPTKEDYCLGFLLCSYLVLIEKESIIDDLMKYLKDLILKIRSANVIHFLAIMVYSKAGDIGQLYFLSDNNELVHLDPMQWDGSVYDRVYKKQYNAYRDHETLDIYVP